MSKRIMNEVMCLAEDLNIEIFGLLFLKILFKYLDHLKLKNLLIF